MLCLIGAASIIVDAAGHRVGLLGIALVNGLTLGAIVSATMNISGGQINPVFTISLVLKGRCSFVRGVAYIGAQLTGGLCAGLTLYLCLGHSFCGA